MISSTMLWENMKKNNKTNPNWNIKFDSILLLQLIIFSLLIFSLMQPYFQEWGRGADRVVLVIDRSASMQAEDVEPDRFSSSIDKAVSRVEEMGDNTELAVVTGYSDPEILINFTEDHSYVIETLDFLTVTDTQINAAESLQIAKSMILTEEQGEVIFFTDGVWEMPQALNFSEIEIVQTGNQVNNVGLVDLGINSLSGIPGEKEIYVKVANYQDQGQEIPLFISNPERTIISDLISLNPGETKGVQYSLQADTRTPFEIQLDVDSPLTVDEKLYTVIGKSEDIRILLIGENNFFLRRVFLSLPGVRVFSEERYNSEIEEQYDLKVFNNVKPQENLTNDAIFINTVPPEMDDLINEQIDTHSRVTSWEKAHPLFRFIDFSKLTFNNILSVKPPADSSILTHSKENPLIFSQKNQNSKHLFMMFDINRSNFPLQVNFPIFLNNSLRWFFPYYYNSGYINLQTGSGLELPFSTENITSITNTGKEKDFTGNLINNRINNLFDSGLYEIEFEDREKDYFAVNLLSPLESNLHLTGVDENIKEQQADIEREEIIFNTPIWPFVVFLIILLLLIEWFLYSRPQKGGN